MLVLFERKCMKMRTKQAVLLLKIQKEDK